MGPEENTNFENENERMRTKEEVILVAFPTEIDENNSDQVAKRGLARMQLLNQGITQEMIKEADEKNLTGEKAMNFFRSKAA